MRVTEGAWTNINGASQEGASLQGLLDDFEEVGIWVSQLMPLSDSSSEIFKTLSGAASGKSLVASIHSKGKMSQWMTPQENWHQNLKERYPEVQFFHTWHRPSPAARSRTQNSLLSEQTAALHL